jgi:hypothetical protein
MYSDQGKGACQQQAVAGTVGRGFSVGGLELSANGSRSKLRHIHEPACTPGIGRGW